MSTDLNLSSLDIWEKVIAQCSETGVNATDIVALACVNSDLCEWVPECIFALNKESIEHMRKICGPDLRVADIGRGPIPFFDRFGVIKGCHTLMPLVKDNAGLAFVIMRSGLTFMNYVEKANTAEISVHLSDPRMPEVLGNIVVEQDHVALVTRGILLNSGSKTIEEQQKLLHLVSCEAPTILDYFAVCVSGLQGDGKCPYNGRLGDFAWCSVGVSAWPIAIGAHPVPVEAWWSLPGTYDPMICLDTFVDRDDEGHIDAGVGALRRL